MKKTNLVIFAFVLIINAVAWTWNPENQATTSRTNALFEWGAENKDNAKLATFSQINGVSYAPFRDGQGPLPADEKHPDRKKVFPSREQIDEDLTLLAPRVSSIRTYGTESTLALIPGLADAHGLKVIQGSYLGPDSKANDAELERLVKLANSNSNITAVLVGNEVLLQDMLEEHVPLLPGRIASERAKIEKYLGDAAQLTTDLKKVRALLGPVAADTIKDVKDGHITLNDRVARDEYFGGKSFSFRVRNQMIVEQTIEYIKRVKAQVKVPVSTADVWNHFRDHPELAEACDFLAVHLLPYWESQPADSSVNYLLKKYGDLQRQYPGKRIVITEVGWPSAGAFKGASVPSHWNQESFIREFIQEAQSRKLDYYVIEAFDQPWKVDLGEGNVGEYWGLFTSDRKPKFDWSTISFAGVPWKIQWLVSAMLGMGAMFLFLRDGKKNLATEGRLLFCLSLQGAASVAVYSGFLIFSASLTPMAKVAWFVLFPAQLLILFIFIVQAYEMAELIWLKKWQRRFLPLPNVPRERYPKVSIHVAACNEPPDMVIATLDSLAKLDYPNFEVLIIDNNTKLEETWKPVEAHCAKLGERFRFFHLPKWPGYKAGALNFALGQTAPDAEIVASIDADYIVESNWLSACIPYFEDPKVGFVQNPQDHRSWGRSFFKEMCNWEYTGFFHIGMVHRNERDAIIQHGTMTLIRRDLMTKLGNWSEWCICEDAELGLRIMNEGYSSVYVNHPFGRGVVVDSFSAYKKQRFRWAYGAVQILKRHWRELLPWKKNNLSLAQKYHFVAGWIPWFGDSLHILCTLAMIAYTAGIIFMPHQFIVPVAAFVAPALVISILNLARSLWLYKARVDCTNEQSWAANLAGMGLTYTIGRAMMTGVLTSGRPFFPTPKGVRQSALSQAFAMAKDEVVLALLLWAGFIGVIAARWYQIGQMPFYFAPLENSKDLPEFLQNISVPHLGYNSQTFLWLGALLLQSAPYAAAGICAVIGCLPNLRLYSRETTERRVAALAAKRLARRTGVTAVRPVAGSAGSASPISVMARSTDNRS